jgi:hypothetical protein
MGKEAMNQIQFLEDQFFNVSDDEVRYNRLWTSWAMGQNVQRGCAEIVENQVLAPGVFSYPVAYNNHYRMLV